MRSRRRRRRRGPVWQRSTSLPGFTGRRWGAAFDGGGRADGDPQYWGRRWIDHGHCTIWRWWRSRIIGPIAGSDTHLSVRGRSWRGVSKEYGVVGAPRGCRGFPRKMALADAGSSVCSCGLLRSDSDGGEEFQRARWEAGEGVGG